MWISSNLINVNQRHRCKHVVDSKLNLVSLLEPPPLAGSSSSLIGSELLLQPRIVVLTVPNQNAEQSLVGYFFTCSPCSLSLSHDASIDVFSLISLHKRLVV